MNTYIILKQGDFLYNFRCRTRIAGGFMIRYYVANKSKDNKISHRIICSDYYNPHIKRANIYYLKGQKRGKLSLQWVTICYCSFSKLLDNYCLCYNLLISK
nr:MAG TPA: hypothetical protein [Siphoviridae sp. ct6662]